MFIEYIPGRSIIHKLDIRPKVIAFICLLVMLFLFPHPAYNAGILLLVLVVAAVARLPFTKIQSIIAPLIPVFVLIVIITGYTYPTASFASDQARRVLFYSWPGHRLPVTVGGLLYGLTLFLRILTMVISSSIVTLTTPLDDFLQLMQILHIPYELSFIITTGIRFVPTMERKASLVLDAQRARGALIETGGMVQRIKAYVPIMVPLIVDSIRMSENLACAMLNRGFGATRKWQSFKKLSLQLIDYLVLISVIALTVLAVYLSRHGYGIL
ncbi:MAG TPA: energy-coupling factor transporter transmembrane protein EcfT [Firmicutes bacterium]|nr:energy-coupling factor transporter transmembrane protein EcfT [Bacillota bacterium]